MNITHELKKVALAATIALIAVPAFAQTTATTVPVGFITVNIPAATPPTVPDQTAAFSVPLYNNADFQGKIGSVDSATQLTLTGAAFAGSNNFVVASAPRAVRVKTAANAASVGLLFLITANTTTQVTVGAAPDLTTILAPNDTVEIVQINTIGSLFGTTTPLLYPNTDISLADNVYLLTKTVGGADQWVTYYHNGTNWRKSGAGSNQNNAIVYPDEGVLIVHRGTAPVTLTVMGTVPSTSEQTDLFGAGSTFMANRFPSDVTFLATGINTTPGWVSNTDISLADKVYKYDSVTRAWQTFYHNGTNWRRSGAGSNQNTTPIAVGTAVIITRSAATGTSLTQVLPYSL